MTGGLLQLISFGAQDVYLTKDPKITFFKVVYKRYVNFSMAVIDKGLSDVDFDKSITYKIPSDGVKKHNSTLFLSISDPAHGKIYSWKSGKFYGLIRMISSKKEKEKICRIWQEEIGKFTTVDNYGKNSYQRVTSKIGSNKACFDLDEGKWVMVDENYHFKN